MLENRPLREAREAFQALDEAWAGHRAGCPGCVRAVRTRHLEDMCGPGWDVYRERREANGELTRERTLAKQPVPGQDELFPELTP